MESDDASRPIFDEDGGRCAFCATEGVAMLVGSCEADEGDTASPHAEQKRAASEMPDPHFGQAITVMRSLAAYVGQFAGVGIGAGACPGGAAGVPMGLGPGVSPVFGTILDVFPLIIDVHVLPSDELDRS